MRRIAVGPGAAWMLAALMCLEAVIVLAGATAVGHWEGPITLPHTEITVLVDLVQNADGTWSGSVDIPVQSAKGLPLKDITVDGNNIGFAIVGPEGDPTFRGKLSDDGASINGEFTQSGQTYPFNLARSGEARAAARSAATENVLEGFDGFVEESLAKWNVPGTGIAIVRDGAPVLVKGYGFRDVEGKVPATENTQFAIGSATKAFTALILGMLVEEGRVAWDKPVREYLPAFSLHDDYATREMTPRDLVCHRSGLPRHDLLWYGSPLSRKDLFERLRYLEPNVSFRSEFQYQNLMFMTAGYLEGEVAGRSWEDLVRDRIFGPLGMTNSTLSVHDMQRASDFSYGYEKKKNEKTKKEEISRMPLRNIDAMGPAGAINSTAADMAKWVAFQMNGGKAGERQIVSGATMSELHKPQMIVHSGVFAQLLKQPEMPYMMYALGWFVQPYRGHDMVHHGGNIDGFSAFVAFMPVDRVGIVVLTNANGTLFPQVIALTAFDRFLQVEATDWNERLLAARSQFEKAEEEAGKAEEVTRKSGTKLSHPLDDYAGTYTDPAYGSIGFARDGKSLRGTYNGMALDLEHWHYDVFRCASEPAKGLRVEFLTNPGGEIDRVKIAMEPSVDAIEFVKEPPKGMFEKSFLAKFTGDYELMGMTVTVAMRGDNGLTVTVPGQPTYELEPYLGTEFRIASLSGYSVKFVSEKGKVSQLVFIQPNGVFMAKRRG